MYRIALVCGSVPLPASILVGDVIWEVAHLPLYAIWRSRGRGGCDSISADRIDWGGR